MFDQKKQPTSERILSILGRSGIEPLLDSNKASSTEQATNSERGAVKSSQREHSGTEFEIDRKKIAQRVSVAYEDKLLVSREEAAQLLSISQRIVDDPTQSRQLEYVPLRKPPTRVGAYVPERLIDSEEAASIIKVHPKTLQRLARRKLIKGVQIGTHWRFRASDIEAWYQQKLAG